jgi:regulator of ribonuclease activity A
VQLHGAAGVAAIGVRERTLQVGIGQDPAAVAAKNGWAGVVIYGCARDADEIDACAIGVRALALHPRRSVKRGEGQRDIEVTFMGSTIRPGQGLYADRDGVIVSDVRLH